MICIVQYCSIKESRSVQNWVELRKLLYCVYTWHRIWCNFYIVLHQLKLPVTPSFTPPYAVVHRAKNLYTLKPKVWRFYLLPITLFIGIKLFLSMYLDNLMSNNWRTSWSAILDQSCMSEIPLWHHNCVVIALWHLRLSLTYKIYRGIRNRTPWPTDQS